MTNEPFNFWNDLKAYDLDGLLSALSKMSDDEFSSYVNNSKNDFANWIAGSLQKTELAEKVRAVVEKDLIKATISSFMESEKNKLIIGTGKSIQEDSLIREVMKKNEDFFKYSEENKTPEEKLKEEHHLDDKKEDKKLPSDHDKKADAETQKTEKGSKLTLMDVPALKTGKHRSADLFVGIFFGIIVGVLLTLIVIQLLALGW